MRSTPFRSTTYLTTTAMISPASLRGTVVYKKPLYYCFYVQ
ncbi:hypothetical protein PCARR_a2103 [Pseudoalteromonas carrageenovora IAM 12662]|uniref:Uncharacterized protein n=1 Tax=Pseudoalteromonas carrageenovora IAM 12662 TaxID=1314868 RepID=A0ABR9EWW6_PSEVC|nr:hypothetical protein [Pseudoalteromonas carrageenovora IAM 12662]